MEIIIRNTDNRPIYEQIVGQIKAGILKGDLPAGEALPSLRLLARDLRVSVITTKRAYEELERDGYLITVPGKGCFVAPQNPALVREEAMRRVEEHLAQAVETARTAGVSQAEVEETLRLLYQEE